MISPGWDSTSIWNEATGETFGEAYGRFEGLGTTFVEAEDVPRLVREGFEVWSFGYGDDPEEFTVIDLDDLWWFEEDIEAARGEWGPFVYDPTEEHAPPVENTVVLGYVPVSKG